MSRFWEILFCVPLLFRRHVCVSFLKRTPSHELPLTAHKTVLNHFKRHSLRWLGPLGWGLWGGGLSVVITISMVDFLTLHLPLQWKNMFSFSLINLYFLCFKLSIVHVHYQTQKLELKQKVVFWNTKFWRRIKLNLKIYLLS